MRQECRYCGEPSNGKRYCKDSCRELDMLFDDGMESYKDENGSITKAGSQFVNESLNKIEVYNLIKSISESFSDRIRTELETRREYE